MAETWTEASASPGRLDRWLDRLPLPSFWAGAAVLASIAIVYVASAAWTGQLDALRRPGATLGLERSVRYDLVLATLVAYTVGVSRFARRRIFGDLAELRGLLRPGPTVERLLEGVREQGGRPHVVAMLAGGLFGVALEFTARSIVGGKLELSAFFLIWSVGLNVGLFALLGRMTHMSLKSARLLSTLGRQHTEVRLLEPESREVFARFGVRAAAFWFVGSSIASLLALEAVTPWIVLVVMMMTLGVGMLALLLPARGIHHAVHEAKRGELAWVRRAVVEEREWLARADEPAERAARLPALLSYEARIEAVREWPFDTPLMLRFSLFLLLPLGSWLGGALVERLVDLLLG